MRIRDQLSEMAIGMLSVVVIITIIAAIPALIISVIFSKQLRAEIRKIHG